MPGTVPMCIGRSNRSSTTKMFIGRRNRQSRNRTTNTTRLIHNAFLVIDRLDLRSAGSAHLSRASR